MAIGYILHRSTGFHPTVSLDFSRVRGWLRTLAERHSPQPCSARPLGLHLPERVWRRHSAWLTCLAERDPGDR